MTDLAKPTDAEDIAKLLVHYSFDLDGYRPEQLVQHWFALYPTDWIRLAVIEALYQGRYKVVSVEQILAIWQRRQKPIPHFNGEFQRIVSSRLPKSLRERSSLDATDDRSPSHFEDWPGPERWLRRVEAVNASKTATAHGRGLLKDGVASLSSSDSSAVQELAQQGSDSPAVMANTLPSTKSSNGTHESYESLNGSSSELVVVIDARDESAIAPESQRLLELEESQPVSPAAAYVESVPELDTAHAANGTEKAENGTSCAKASSANSEVKTVEWSVHYPVRTSSISQFVPTGRPSGFYSRLKAVVQRHVFSPSSTGDASAELSSPHDMDCGPE